jgi:hypothetical protein
MITVFGAHAHGNADMMGSRFQFKQGWNGLAATRRTKIKKSNE